MGGQKSPFAGGLFRKSCRAASAVIPAGKPRGSTPAEKGEKAAEGGEAGKGLFGSFSSSFKGLFGAFSSAFRFSELGVV